MSFIPFLQAAGAAGASTSQGFLVTVMPFLLIIVVFYFFLIRPQNKKQKETDKMISALKKGDKVVTIGGIHGVVTSTKEKTLIVKIDENTKIEINRSAVSAVTVDEKAEAKAKRAETKEKKADKKEKELEKKAEEKEKELEKKIEE